MSLVGLELLRVKADLTCAEMIRLTAPARLPRGKEKGGSRVGRQAISGLQGTHFQEVSQRKIDGEGEHEPN